MNVGHLRAREFAAKLRGWEFFCFDPIGLFGGIWLFWQKGFAQIVILQENRYFLHFQVNVLGCPPCFITLVYASTLASIRNKMWEDICNLQVVANESWFVVGYFNDITCMTDRNGGSQNYVNRCAHHQRQVQSVNLIDMGASGSRFTWRHNRLPVCLDRCYTNMIGRVFFSSAVVTNLPFCHSDHCPLLL